jgi:hypothetical protein
MLCLIYALCLFYSHYYNLEFKRQICQAYQLMFYTSSELTEACACIHYQPNARLESQAVLKEEDIITYRLSEHKAGFRESFLFTFKL